MFLFIGFGAPVLTIILRRTYDWCIARGYKNWVFRIIDTALPNIYKPVENVNYAISANQRGMSYFGKMVIDFLNDIKVNRNTEYFKNETYSVSITTSFAVLLTFGIVFPPLGIIVCVTTIMHIVWVHLTIGRFLCEAKEKNLPHLAEQLMNECKNVDADLRLIMWALSGFAAMFYAYFLFDMVGDEIGAVKAIWAPCVMCSIPVIFYIVLYIVRRKGKLISYDDKSASVTGSPDIELTDIANANDAGGTVQNIIHDDKLADTNSQAVDIADQPPSSVVFVVEDNTKTSTQQQVLDICDHHA